MPSHALPLFPLLAYKLAVSVCSDEPHTACPYMRSLSFQYWPVTAYKLAVSVCVLMSHTLHAQVHLRGHHYIFAGRVGMGVVKDYSTLIVSTEHK